LNPQNYATLGPVQILGFACIISLLTLAFTIAQGFKLIKGLTAELAGRPCLWANRVSIKQ
jgi:hypothetical protein